jgi:hypothetical protein
MKVGHQSQAFRAGESVPAQPHHLFIGVKLVCAVISSMLACLGVPVVCIRPRLISWKRRTRSMF